MKIFNFLKKKKNKKKIVEKSTKPISSNINNDFNYVKDLKNNSNKTNISNTSYEITSKNDILDNWYLYEDTINNCNIHNDNHYETCKSNNYNNSYNNNDNYNDNNNYYDDDNDDNYSYYNEDSYNSSNSYDDEYDNNNNSYYGYDDEDSYNSYSSYNNDDNNYNY